MVEVAPRWPQGTAVFCGSWLHRCACLGLATWDRVWP